MSARFHLQQGNWRAAIVEVQTAFEAFVSQTIREHYVKGGLRDAKLAKIMKCPLANLIADHLPKAVGKTFVTGQADHDRWHGRTYMMRNSVVHDGYIPSGKEAIDAILAVELALEYLVGRPKEKFWPKRKPPTVANEFLVSD